MMFRDVCLVSFFVCAPLVEKQSNYCTRFGAAIAAIHSGYMLGIALDVHTSII
jgi:hypothetical protein